MAFGFGLALPRAKNGFAGPYIVNGFDPTTVTDFANNYFRSGGVQSTFESMFDYTGASLKTMTDSDGKLKWGPHNFLSYSEQFDDAYWVKTASGTGSVPVVSPNFGLSPDGTLTADRLQLDSGLAGNSQIASISFATSIGAVYTFSVWMRSLSGSPIVSMFNNSATQNVTVTPTWQMFTFTQTATLASDTARLAKRDVFSSSGTADILVWGAHLFRSDLGGMVNNPDTGNSYVPTTTSAVYLSRRGNYLYNGTAWVNKGLLLESQARTNLILLSDDMSAVYWTKSNITVTANQTVAPDGSLTADLITGSSSTSNIKNITGSATTNTIGGWTFSVWVKKNTQTNVVIRINDNTGLNGSRANINLDTGAVGTVTNDGTATGGGVTTESWGNGWWRVRVTTNFVSAIFSINSNVWFDTYGFSTSTNSFFMWGAQLEQAATPSSYIPTAGAAVTRAAELLQVKAPNLAVGANDFTNTLYWPTTKTSNGVTATKGAVGFEDGSPWVEYRYTGTPIAATVEVGFVDVLSRTPSSIGDTWTSSFIGRRVGGTLTGVTGLRAAIVSETAPSTFISNGFGAVTPAETDTVVFATATTSAGNQVRFGMFVAVTIGILIDVTYRIKGLQFDRGASRVTYPDQSNISMQIDGTMTGTPSTFTRWGGSLTNYLMQSASVGAYEFDTYVNLALGADDYTGSRWISSFTNNGITVTRGTIAADYVEYSVTGTALAGVGIGPYDGFPVRTSASAGEVFTGSTIVQVVTGTAPVGGGIRQFVGALSAAGTLLQFSYGALSAAATETTITHRPTMPANTATVWTGADITIPLGATANFTIRIRGLQLDKAASRLTYAVRGGSFTSGIDVPFNVASRHGATYINGAVNGTALTASSSTLPFPVLNASPIQLGPTFMGNIGDFRQWNTDVGNAGIVAASAPSLLPSLNLNFDSSNSSYIVNDWSE